MADRQLDPSILLGTEIFGGLTAEALDQATKVARQRRFTAGTALFTQGDRASAFCVLLDGELKMVQNSPEGQQVVLRYIGPGEMFGAVAVFCRTEYPATAVAVADALVASWDAATAEMLMLHYPRMSANALRVVGERLQELQNRYRELATERVERRIAHTLLRLVLKAGQPVSAGTRIEFPISRQDIAEMTGATLHTVSRILSGWETRGLVEGGRREVILRQPEALLRIAEDL